MCTLGKAAWYAKDIGLPWDSFPVNCDAQVGPSVGFLAFLPILCLFD